MPKLGSGRSGSYTATFASAGGVIYLHKTGRDPEMTAFQERLHIGWLTNLSRLVPT
jgi:hypothetical protein